MNEAANNTPQKTRIIIALDDFRVTTGVNEESPKGILDVNTRETVEAIGEDFATVAIHKNKTILGTTRRDSSTVTNIHMDTIKSTLGASSRFIASSTGLVGQFPFEKIVNEAGMGINTAVNL
jgi:hypothetical protein